MTNKCSTDKCENEAEYMQMKSGKVLCEDCTRGITVKMVNTKEVYSYTITKELDSDGN